MKQTLLLTTAVVLLGAAAQAAADLKPVGAPTHEQAVNLTTNAGELQPFWLSAPPTSTSAPDTHTALRGTFELKAAGEVELRVLGATWFSLWVDGEYLADGPARFPRSHPEYDTLRLKLAAGKHVLAAQVHYEGRYAGDVGDAAVFRVRREPARTTGGNCLAGAAADGLSLRHAPSQPAARLDGMVRHATDSSQLAGA